MQNKIPVFILNKLVILPNQEIKIDLTTALSKNVVISALKNNLNKVLVIAPKNSLETSPTFEDLPKVGVVASIKSKLELSNGTLRVVLQGENRLKINKYFQNKETGVLKCSGEVIELPIFDKSKESALKRKLISKVKSFINDNKNVSNSILNQINENVDIEFLTDIVASFLTLSFEKKLFFMETINPVYRAKELIKIINEELHLITLDKELDEKINDNIESSQREFFLKEKLREINMELGYDKESEVLSLEKALNELILSDKTKEKFLSEIKKYASSSEFSPDASIVKNYLNVVLNLPWNKSSIQNTDLKKISELLNESHYGLKEIKDRILEYVAVLKKNPSLKAPIICLVGPPGVGKTSIAMSIAKALGREFYKISVGGLNDSTELIGSRRTYLGSAPGKIMQGIIKCKVNNPLILIDEVDKMVKDYKGDPASTMLEILDETQNNMFTDNYIEEPFDLSNVMFILTANDETCIPKTLSDRLEIINLDSYTIYEKIDIAKNYLIKDVTSMLNTDLKINKDVIKYIVEFYTKEPGVRELKRILEKLFRKVVVNEDVKMITTSLVHKYLGEENQNFLPEIRDYGIANILAYTNLGGTMSHVEVSKVKGTGKFFVTGLAGDVLKESVNVALSYVQSTFNINISENDTHIHFLTASSKKDGPSAGVSIVSAIISMYNHKLIKNDIAFTGEITLKGQILPIGGLKEKLIASQSAGIKTIYIPKANVHDLEKVPIDVLSALDVKMVDNYSEIYDALFR